MLGDFDDDHALAGRDGHRRKADDDMRVDERENAAAQREEPRDMRRRAGHLDRCPDGADRMDRAAAERAARGGDDRDARKVFHHADYPPTLRRLASSRAWRAYR